MSKNQGTYGGRRTEIKVERVGQICAAFLNDMKDKPRKTVYIDACCGSGIVQLPAPKQRSGGFFKHLNQAPCIEGSPVQVLNLPEAFTKYYFVDQSPKCCRKLKKLIRSQFPLRKKKTNVVCEDINSFLQDYCESTRWKKRRAVIFLDPFGPVVEWETIEAIAETRAADLLYMFPAGISVARLLKRDGKIGRKAKATLTRIFGNKNWYDDLYTTFEKQRLLDTVEVTQRQPGCEGITKYFVERLRSVFAHVAPNPLRLQNKTGLTMYSLCFASPSKRRTEIARKLFNSARLMQGLALPRVGTLKSTG